MKLVLATPLYPPEPGGPATYAKLLVEGLPGKDFSVELVKFSEVRHLPKLVRHVAYTWRALGALRRADAALVLDPVSTGLPVCIAAWLARKPFVVKIVGDYAWEQGQQRFGITATLDEFVQQKRVPLPVWFLRKVQSEVASYARQIIVPSEYLKSVVMAWGISGDKINVIHNAVSLDALGEVPQAVQELPRPLVATAGRLVPWKHVDGIIDAVAQLRVGGIEASLAIIGDGPELARLVSHAEATLRGGYVVTGALSHADTLATMQSADVFVLNSSYEGLSHLLIEALMLSVPTVATEVGGNAEVITHGESGLLTPAGDTNALALALTRVLSDSAFADTLRKGAKSASHQFSEEKMLSETRVLLVTL